MERLLAEAGLKSGDVTQYVATGYGRYAISFADKRITEITCHARGVLHLHPEVRTIIEIGGQDSKIIRLSERGDVEDFSMNDRCAAGTGRFLEVLVDRLAFDIESLDRFAGHSARPVPINSMCVVFAETEITGLLADGCPAEDIIAGVQESIARRVSGMLGGDIVAPIIFTGGVARFSAMRKGMERIVGMKMETPEHPELTGALGAALIASERVEKIEQKN
jgi:predicted CoA-substrate-specific enzyme activase